MDVLMKTYQNFKGVDFSTSPAQVDDAHSPLCENIVADFAGYPEKRVGWRKTCSVMAPVNGMWNVVFTSGTTRKIVHGGTKLYSCNNDAPTEIYASMNNAKSVGFVHGGKLYILDGAHYLCVYESGSSLLVALVTSLDVHIPTTCIARVPDGVTVPVGSTVKASTPYEEVNLLTPKAKNSFAGTASATVYVLDTKAVDSIVEVKVNGVVVASSGWTFSTANSNNYNYPTVTFTTAPGISTLGAGVDNVVITWSKTVSGNSDKITKCTIVAEYGYYNDNRFFFAGNPSAQNTDWSSGVDDPTYWPEFGYTKVGADTNPIMGYLKQGDSLAIIKADNEQDAEIFMRTATLDSEGSVIFPVKQGIKGVGAIAKGGFANMVTDALFLAKEGVFGVVTTNTQNERKAVNRSFFVNAKLTKEEGLANAVMSNWNGLLLVALNSVCYVADIRQGDYQWYYWTNIPACVFLNVADALYFGTEEGDICRFNNDIDRMEKYSDEGTLVSGAIQNGVAITARWSTKADALGYLTVRKTMLKKGSGVMIKPYNRSSVKIYILTDRQDKTKIKESMMDIFNFEDIDFERLTFNALDTPKTIPFNTKVKKFITLQLIFENDTVAEGFGIYGTQIQYVLGQYVK